MGGEKPWDKVFDRNIDNQQFDEFVRSLLDQFWEKFSSSAKLLDAGCGNGEMVDYLSQKGLDVMGVDFSQVAIEYAQQNFKGLFQVGSLEKLEFDDGSFDGVLCLAVLHCLVGGMRERVVAELSRILKQSGVMVGLVLSSKDTSMVGGEKIEERTYRQKSGLVYHLFTQKELRELFSGFEILEIEHYQQGGKAVYTFMARKS